MSTLAATKADGFYYPPDWTPEGGSQNKFKGSKGSLGKRANKMDQGILTIRFEMPFNVACKGCNKTIAKGVRFNAEKKAIGKYHSTPIYSFRMISPCCNQTIEVHTDPKAAEYILVEGAERRVAEQYSAADAGTQEIELQTREERDAMLSDPFSKLERGVGDERRAKAAAPTIIELNEMSKERWKNDYDLNKALRRNMRGQKKELAAVKAETRAVGLPEHMRLLPKSEEDAAAAREAFRFGPKGKNVFDRNRKEKRAAIKSSSIFSGAAASSNYQRSASGGASSSGGSSTAFGLAARKAAATSRSIASRAEMLAKRRASESGATMFSRSS